METDHSKRTTVCSTEEGLEAFNRYKEYFDYICSNRESDSNIAILLPCGKKKPIGSSSIHKKKLTALRQSGLSQDGDIRILSEPCTIIPHDMRLSLPAVNYDFPPEYTEKEQAPKVFEVFTDNLADWIEKREYSTIYAYLVEGHQNKLDAAMKKSDDTPEVIEIPGASYNPETGKYSGDLFKKAEHVAIKIEFVQAIRGNRLSLDELREKYSEDVVNFYIERLN